VIPRGPLRSAVASLPGARPAYSYVMARAPRWRREVRATAATWQEAGWRPSGGRPMAARALGRRVDELARLTGDPAWRGRRAGATEVVAAHLRTAPEDAPTAGAWTVLAVLTARLPTEAEVLALHRAVGLEGAEQAAAELLGRTLRRLGRPGPRRPDVRVVDDVLVDVTITSATTYMTGIQRVVRETVDRWLAAHPSARLVRWAEDGRRLVEVDRATWLARLPLTGPPGDSLVPYRTTLLVPELAVGTERTTRTAALGAHAGGTLAVIGFDCVPVSTAETTALAMGGAFAGALAATREADRVATISAAAGTEYRGWCRTVRASRPHAPEVGVVVLPTAPPATDPGGAAGWREVLRSVPGRPDGSTDPVVLAVGSHEPRKNHEGLLHAAEVLWQEGRRFSLVFVGGNAWHSEAFVERLDLLAGRGRPVVSVSALPDAALAAGYADARVTAFLSFNEGFGLPVTESLGLGTPVLTSAHGSMAEIAADGGVVTVDPRDDDAVVDALRTLLTDDALLAELRRQAAARPRRTWDDYAQETWAWLVEGQASPKRS
jgi:hypothetical protein